MGSSSSLAPYLSMDNTSSSPLYQYNVCSGNVMNGLGSALIMTPWSSVSLFLDTYILLALHQPYPGSTMAGFVDYMNLASRGAVCRGAVSVSCGPPSLDTVCRISNPVSIVYISYRICISRTQDPPWRDNNYRVHLSMGPARALASFTSGLYEPSFSQIPFSHHGTTLMVTCGLNCRKSCNLVSDVRK